RSNFRQHLERCLAARRNEISPCYPFLEFGLYYAQVKRYLDLFPPDHIRIYWYEEAWQSPYTFMADIFEFLGVDPCFRPDLSQRSLQRRVPRTIGLRYFLKQSDWLQPLQRVVPQRVRPVFHRIAFREPGVLKMDRADRRFLVDYYRDDVLALAHLLHRDL